MTESSQPLTSILGKYRHYRGNEYEVLGVGKHTETEEEMVIYKALYPPFETWLRPYEMFFETVEVNSERIARFTRITDQPIGEL